MPAPNGNKNAAKSKEDLIVLITAYIDHRAKGYSKKSFPDCDYETIEKYIESEVDFRPLKKELVKAERKGRYYWECMGQKIANGELKGNPATWIFTMKNKFPDEWKEKTESEVNIKEFPITGVRIENDGADK